MHRDDIELLLEEVWWRADAALALIGEGAAAPSAVASTRLLALFDGTFDERIADGRLGDELTGNGTAQLGDYGSFASDSPAWHADGDVFTEALDADWVDGDSGDPPPDVAARRDAVVAEALGQMLNVCCAPGSADDPSWSVTRLVSLAALVARYAPDAAWQLRVEHMVHLLAAGHEQDPAFTAARHDAVARLGSLRRVLDAVEAWQPDAAERSRLRALTMRHGGVDAICQALAQAVFAAELRDVRGVPGAAP